MTSRKPIQSLSALVLAVASMCSCSGVAAAQDGPGWYVLPSYQITGLNDSNLELRQGATRTSFDSKFGDDTHPAIAIGYALAKPYRIDVEYTQHSSDFKAQASPVGGDALQAYTFVASAWREFAPWPQIRPYVGFGLGAARLEVGDVAAGTGGSSVDGMCAVIQFGAGVQWYFLSRLPRFALDMGFRYQLAPGNPELSGGSSTLTTDYQARTWGIGLRYNFWGFSSTP